MKLLSRIGNIALEITKAIIGFGPVAKMVTTYDNHIDTFIDKITELQDVIIKVEIMGQALGLAGPDKLKAAGPLVAQVILSSSILANKKIENNILFQAGCTKVADGMADILNSLKDDVETEDH